MSNPYDELAYRCLPIEWTAPERLALASMLHDGPRPRSHGYRVLELGCGDGANLLPLAHYRRAASFVGLDGAGSQIALANERRVLLELPNISFVHADFCSAESVVEGEFDYIIAHGVFSWVPDSARDALLRLCSRKLLPDGLLYLNYNTYPGWSIRGLVRDFLLGQTANAGSLAQRARQAQQVASEIAAALETSAAAADSPYSRLIANEFSFVCEHDPSYVAHEFLSEVNQPYWRGDFLNLLKSHGFDFVADADFSYRSGRLPVDLAPQLRESKWVGRGVENTVDLLCYRQLHSPILALATSERRPLGVDTIRSWRLASCLTPVEHENTTDVWFEHPSSGYQVETRASAIRSALSRLHPLWPRSLLLIDLFSDLSGVMEDLLLLHRNGLVELRLAEPSDPGADGQALALMEAGIAGYATTPYHTRVAAAA